MTAVTSRAACAACVDGRGDRGDRDDMDTDGYAADRARVLEEAC